MEFGMETQRIAITGPESTGKSTLARTLAQQCGGLWVPEYAREWLEVRKGTYTAEDVETMAQGQIASEAEFAAQHPHWLFCDTDLLVIRVWLEYRFGDCPQWIIEGSRGLQYHQTLLMDIDLPWEPDPLREHPQARVELLDRYETHLKAMQRPYVKISGTHQARVEAALQAIGWSIR